MSVLLNRIIVYCETLYLSSERTELAQFKGSSSVCHLLILSCDWFNRLAMENGETAELVAAEMETVTLAVQVEVEDSETVTSQEVVDRYVHTCLLKTVQFDLQLNSFPLRYPGHSCKITWGHVSG